jgi:AraC-like DNA-binding protein
VQARVSAAPHQAEHDEQGFFPRPPARLIESRDGWAGFKDPFVSPALSLLHGRVADEWTVDDLGSEVGLSRSALADRFTRLIGEPPMCYLARWRIQVAAQQLRNRDTSLARFAEQVGYESEAAFNPRSSATSVSLRPPGARTRQRRKMRSPNWRARIRSASPQSCDISDARRQFGFVPKAVIPTSSPMQHCQRPAQSEQFCSDADQSCE